jgi:hypothetical protein
MYTDCQARQQPDSNMHMQALHHLHMQDNTLCKKERPCVVDARHLPASPWGGVWGRNLMYSEREPDGGQHSTTATATVKNPLQTGSSTQRHKLWCARHAKSARLWQALSPHAAPLASRCSNTRSTVDTWTTLQPTTTVQALTSTAKSHGTCMLLANNIQQPPACVRMYAR